MKQINKLWIGLVLIMLVGTSLSIAGDTLAKANKQVELTKECYDILKTKNITVSSTECELDKCYWNVYINGIEKDTWGLEKVTNFDDKVLTPQRDEVIVAQTQKLCDEYLKVKPTKTLIIGEGDISLKEKGK